MASLKYKDPVTGEWTYVAVNGGGAVTPESIGVSNPNLLDNWYFADPVDQRDGYVVPPGVQMYSDAALTKPSSVSATYHKVAGLEGNIAKVYNVAQTAVAHYVDTNYIVRGYGKGGCVDRWILQQITSAGLLIADGYVTLNATNNDGLIQRLSPKQLAEGDTLTISVLTAEGELLTKTVTLSTTVTKYQYNDIWSCAIGYVSSTNTWNVYPIITYVGSEQTINIKAVKLELGSTQTLAHQDENGNWVLNDPPPNKGMELLKCCMSTADSTDTYANNNVTAKAVGSAKSEVVSYVGTGVYGSTNPTSITFSFAPRAIILLGCMTASGIYNTGTNAGTPAESRQMTYCDAWPTVYTEGFGFSYSNNPKLYGKKSADEKTFYWYIQSSSAHYQANGADTTYYYLAIG